MLTKTQIEEIAVREFNAIVRCPGTCGAWKYASDSDDEIYSDLRALLQHIEELEARQELLEGVLAEAKDWCCQECGQILSEPADPDAGQPCDCCEALYNKIHACDAVTTA